MKKLIMFMLAAVMLLASCGGRGGNAKQSQNSDSKVTTGTDVITGTEGTTGAQAPDIPIEEALVVPEGELREGIESALKKKDFMLNEIKWTKVTESGKIEDWFRCYGIFNGCAVIFSDGTACVIDIKTVAGYDFANGSAFALYGYKDGTLYDLADAFDKGFITKEEVGIAAGRHKAVTDFLHGDGFHDGLTESGR